MARWLPAGVLVLALASPGEAAVEAGLSPSALEPAAAAGVAELDRALAKLSGHRRLLMIAAHPDDEDNSLLTLVERGWGGDAAYLSLSRGEGGQNLIGEELGVGLGLLRSRELLSARSVDGARQFFSRAYDFGYTRSLEETLERWPREELLEDTVRVIRRFKPQVVVAIFPPDARAGHGHHQLSALIAEEAFDLAGDLQAFPELRSEGLGPWSPLAFYRSGWFDQEAPALTFPLGGLGPVDGRSLWQISRASRSRHRSQDMGSSQDLGSPINRWVPAGVIAGEALAAVEAGAPSEGPFTGIDTSLAALAAGLEDGRVRREVAEVLSRVEARARTLRRSLSPRVLAEERSRVTGELFGLVSSLRQAQRWLGTPEAGSPAGAVAELLGEKTAVAETALLGAAGLVFDAATESGTLIPGEGVTVTLTLWNAGDSWGPAPLRVRSVALEVPPGWPAAEPTETIPPEGESLAEGQLQRWSFAVVPSLEAAPSRPYFLLRPRQGDLYDWSAVPPEVRGEPFAPPPLTAALVLELPAPINHEAPEGESGQGESLELDLTREVVHRFNDQAVGEIRRPLRVVPTLEVLAEPDLLVWRQGGRSSTAANHPTETLQVRLSNPRSEVQRGRLMVHWEPQGGAGGADPSRGSLPPLPFEVAGGAQLALAVDLTPLRGLAPGSYRLRVEAEAEGGRRSSHAYPLVDYPHIRATPLPVEAAVGLRIADLELPELKRLGYVRGAADRVPEALERVGLPVEVLKAESLSTGDLSVYDVIVIGSRAYETDPELRAANGRLLDWARRGGRLVVQFQQYAFVEGGFAPYSLTIARPHDRVTDEASAVDVLEPDAPHFHQPNEISARDWGGWVQERGLYFAHTWDETFTPLLSLPGPAGESLHGGLLEAPLGDGSYLYTGLAFFRQLPAGNVGATRLFLNLLTDPR